MGRVINSLENCILGNLKFWFVAKQISRGFECHLKARFQLSYIKKKSRYFSAEFRHTVNLSFLEATFWFSNNIEWTSLTVISMLVHIFSLLSTLFQLKKALWTYLTSKSIIKWSELKEGKVELKAWLWVRGQQQRGVVQNIRGTEKSLSLKANIWQSLEDYFIRFALCCQSIQSIA